MSERKEDPNKRRSPDKKSQTFWLHRKTIKKLDELALASRFSKTDLINYWIETEYTRQLLANKLKVSEVPFPDTEKPSKTARKKVKSKRART